MVWINGDRPIIFCLLLKSFWVKGRVGGTWRGSLRSRVRFDRVCVLNGQTGLNERERRARFEGGKVESISLGDS
jgi:hypothetical protein